MFGNTGWIIPAMLCVSGSLMAQSQPAKESRSMTGCLDERPGPQYVLLAVQQLRLMAELSPQGFPVEGFAKHLGHRVEVTGIVSPAKQAGGAPRMQVRRIRDISPVCEASASDRAAPRRAASNVPGTTRKTAAKQDQVAAGCLDEKPGPQYVLRDPGDLRVLFEVEPEGFPVQLFAKHLGHQVRLEGTTYESAGKPRMKVRKIVDNASVCAPARR